MNYVIVGNSVAAVGAIRAIRELDQQGNIIVISRERHNVYGRPLISYLLGGLINEKRMSYLPDDFYLRHRINLLLNSEVVAVDSSAKKVRLAGGDVIPYDKLLLATGGDPFVLTERKCGAPAAIRRMAKALFDRKIRRYS